MTIAEADFLGEARSFLDANADRRVEEAFEWGQGSDRVGILEEKSPKEEAEEAAAAKAWKALEFDADFGWITGPEEYGGRALPTSYERAYRELAADYAIPSLGLFTIGLGMIRLSMFSTKCFIGTCASMM